MKILVFSDSHHTVSPMYNAIKQNQPQMVIHLGDCIKDAMEIKNDFFEINFQFVSGNNDFDYSIPNYKTIVVENKTIFLAHGHNYNVKFGMQFIFNTAKKANADILLFGHTHIPYNSIDYGMYVLNPGSCGKSYFRKATYGILTIKEGKINATIEKI